MPQTLQKIQEKYPALAENLSYLPPRLVEEVGQAALLMTHMGRRRDRAELMEILQDEEVDRVFSNPKSDIHEFANGAIEPELGGQEKLAEVLARTSILLRAAYERVKENPDPSVNEELREIWQRDQIFAEAYDLTTEAALAAENSGDEGLLTQTLEDLILLRHLQGYDSLDRARPAFRILIQRGLTDELLDAIRESGKIFTHSVYPTVADSLYTEKSLLELASGKKLDDNFELQGEIDINSRLVLGRYSEVVDYLAIVTRSGSSIPVEQAMRQIPWDFVKTLEKRLQASLQPEIDELYTTIAKTNNADDMKIVLMFRQPQAITEAAKKLGVPLWRAEILFANWHSDEELATIDPVQVEGMMQLKNSYPQYFDEITRHLDATNYDPLELKAGFDALSRDGLNIPDLLELFTKWADKDEFIETTHKVAQKLRAAGVDPARLAYLIKCSAYHDLPDFIDACRYPDGDIDQEIENLLISEDLVAKYLEAYSQIKYPLFSFRNVDNIRSLKELPHLQKRLLALGLSEDLAQSLFAAWTTYSAYTKNFYKDDEFKLPEESPTEEELFKIATDQMEALERQLEKVELYIVKYGLESFQEIIKHFNTHHFARYTAGQLFDQNQRWLAGEPAKNVIVNALSDWNSFTANNIVFENPQDNEGTFIFEAGSAQETGRIAVKVGQRERAFDREPDVKRFIIHAHGSADGMTMGVNGESIDLGLFRKAASNAKKMKSRANNFRRHLGEDFEVILQACSVANKKVRRNITGAISKHYDVKVHGSGVTIHGATLKSDGNVVYSVDEGSGEAIVYGS